MCQNLPKNMRNHAKIKEYGTEVRCRVTAKSRLLRALEGLGCGFGLGYGFGLVLANLCLSL